MDLISVIVPVYKVEKYLDRCVQSIVDQTYRNLEIILVDDGSPDNCPAMCDAWAEKDNRIKVIHKVNEGVSVARNVGVKHAKGKYVCFIDSDDWIRRLYVEKLHKEIVQNDAEIAVCKMIHVHSLDESNSEPKNVSAGDCQRHMFTQETALRSLVCGGVIQGGPCDKMYLRTLLLDIEFPKGKRHEDEYFTYRVLDKANRVVYIDFELYCYFQHEDSFMHSSPEAHMDALDAYLSRINYLQSRFPELHSLDKVNFCIVCVSIYRDLLSDGRKISKSFRRKVREYRKKVGFSLREVCSYPFGKILYVVCSGVSMPVFAWILNMRRRKELT